MNFEIELISLMSYLNSRKLQRQEVIQILECAKFEAILQKRV